MINTIRLIDLQFSLMIVINGNIPNLLSFETETLEKVTYLSFMMNLPHTDYSS